jgi:hypothetical protein
MPPPHLLQQRALRKLLRVAQAKISDGYYVKGNPQDFS